MTSDSSLPVLKQHIEEDSEGGLQLGKFLGALRRQVLVIVGVTTLTASAAVFKAITDTPVYTSGFELLTNPVSLETTIVSSVSPGQQDQAELLQVALDETKLKVLTSPRVLTPVVEDLQLEFPDIRYSEVYKNLNLKISPTGDTLLVTYKSVDKVKVAAVLERLAEAYLAFGLEDRQRDLQRGIDFVDEQLPTFQQRVERAESELENLRRSAKLLDPTSQGAQLTQQIGQFTQEYLVLQLELQEMEKTYQDLQQELSNNRDLAASQTLVDNENYQDLLGRLIDIDSRLSAESALYLDESPEIGVIEDQRENLLPLLEREGERVMRQLANHIGELQVREQGLRTTIADLDQQLDSLVSTTREYNAIQREIQFATNNLDQFLSQRETLRIDAAQRQSPWELLAPIPSPSANAADAKRNLILGTVLGLLLGSGAALILDRFSGKLYSIDELKAATGLPILGTIPLDPLMEADSLWLQQLQQMTVAQGLPNFSREDWPQPMKMPFFESFRSLYTTLKLSNPDRPYKTIAISSVAPDAGKTTISFYLALAAASMGQRVLVVDADLRRPSLHRYGDLGNEIGLTNLVGEGLDVEKLVQPLSFEPNLWMLTAGTLPPDPTKIISSAAMEKFVHWAAEKFDLVIYDTPPMLGFADSYLMAAHTDGLLLVANLNDLKRTQLDSVLDQLRMTTSSVIGLVANAVNEDVAIDYSYYESYQTSPLHPEGLGKMAKRIPFSKKLPALLGKKGWRQ